MSAEPISRHDRIMHWLLAVLVIGMLILGKIVDEMERIGAYEILRSLHLNLGFLVFILGSYRLWHRVTKGGPTPSASLSSVERRVSTAVQWTLLLTTVLMPISGTSMAIARRVPIDLLGLFEMPRLAERMTTLGSTASEVHEVTAILMLVCILAHVAGALKHHFMDRDDVLRRMMGRP